MSDPTRSGSSSDNHRKRRDERRARVGTRDMSPAAVRLREAVGNAKGAHEAVDQLGGVSRLSDMKLKRDAAAADDKAYEAAMDYRNTHIP